METKDSDGKTILEAWDQVVARKCRKDSGSKNCAWERLLGSFVATEFPKAIE